eukprot:gnl/TRDRNA2_/TRDRNA2_182730_c0_seq1.p1 gnl/TRDRNA2_/TRDRNA2_182730_c0~~gnl/TRDRNA2_/TRDRNA2_182730_c0_seq1.p1  ORF type:complete len:420 (-),score=51.05 gnl/TRDRNA2_/TRDRNA2_182730_c0_seq1:114-1373(-)
MHVLSLTVVIGLSSWSYGLRMTQRSTDSGFVPACLRSLLADLPAGSAEADELTAQLSTMLMNGGEARGIYDMVCQSMHLDSSWPATELDATMPTVRRKITKAKAVIDLHSLNHRGKDEGQLPFRSYWDAPLHGLIGMLPTPRPAKLFFIHIPKNAGTSIEDAGLQHFIRWGTAYFSWPRLLTMKDGSRNGNWAHIPPADFEELGLPNPYAETHTFCVSRHPYRRVLSAYKYYGEAPWGRLSFAGGPMNTSHLCDPDNLNIWVQDAMSQVMNGQMYTHSCFMVPQSYYIWGPPGSSRQWCQKILRTDSLQEDFDDVLVSEGFNPKQWVLKKKNHMQEACPGLTTASFTPKTLAMLGQVYAEDFKRLGYEEERPRLPGTREEERRRTLKSPPAPGGDPPAVVTPYTNLMPELDSKLPASVA